MPETRAVCEALTKTYAVAGGAPVTALQELAADFVAGELTVVAGPSGSGKSTLLRLLACLDRPDGGAVRIDGRDTTRMSSAARRRLRRRRIGYLFQQPSANRIDYLTAREHLLLAARLRGTGAADADRLLDAFGLDGRADHRPAQLSGGEQQRLGVAFAGIGDPALLVCDEPTAQLDHVAGARVIDALRRLATAGGCVVVSSHDPAVVERADRVVRVEHGRVVEAAP